MKVDSLSALPKYKSAHKRAWHTIKPKGESIRVEVTPTVKYYGKANLNPVNV